MLEYTLVQGDPDHDFLKQNPELKFYEFIKRMQKRYDTDTVNGILWSLYLVEDPKSKLYYGIRYEERVQIAEEKYKLSYVEDCLDYKEDYCKAILSTHERNYKRMNDKLQQMFGEIDGADLEDATKFFSQLDKIYKGLDLVENKYAAEILESKNKYRGDIQPGGMYNDNK